MSTPSPTSSAQQLTLDPGGHATAAEDACDVEGSVESIVFQDPSPFTVARVRSGHRSITVVGEMEPPVLGRDYRFVGHWVQHPQYGDQLQTHWYEPLLPTSAGGIEKYLASGIIKGLRKRLARRIVEHFGDETLRVIEETPERLAEIPKLRAEVRARLVAVVQELRATRRVMMFLAGHDISPSLAGKIYRAFGPGCIEIIQRNPYRMADEIPGVGFKIADSVARRLGVCPDDPFRLVAGLMHALREAQDNGHLYLPREELRERAAALLQCDADRIEAALEQAAAASRVVVEDAAVYLHWLHRLEVRIADRVAERSGTGGLPAPTGAQLDAIERSLGGIRLADLQRECLRQSLASGTFIMTGGPGTGKTTTVRSLLEWCRMLGLKATLAAPTGRASRRMTEATGGEARTLHRLLEYAPTEHRFKRDADHPLETDVLIVDETSMVDAWLFAELLEALPAKAHLVLVGDVDQLPSVGAGCVLRDLIDCGRVPVVFLSQIFRQGEGSLIVRNSHRINAGEMPLRGTAEGDYFFITEEDAQRAADQVVSLCTTRLPRHYGLNPIEDIQVISPMYRGPLGVTALNTRLQEQLNPAPPDAPAAAVTNGRARRGDKVMQIRNNYELGAFNGDLGIVTAVDEDDETLRVRLLAPSAGADGESLEIEYGFDAAGELALAYACSVHKSQGSEFPAVVLPVTTAHYVMLQRNLLYTALTRARKLAVLVGQPRALAIAVKNDRVEKRWTRLAERIRERIPGQ